ncbi:MAG TPA: hypothetical protein IAA78_05780 [Candidatus Avamphibacillus intestinigallinarum]|nr:hypothetical protein [Candidatus Avamphibacillus intestinigallinarum]
MEQFNERTELEQKIIEQYQKDEAMMVVVFAQWCINHDLDPVAMYEKAYPGQGKNKALQEGVEKTVPKQEAEEISNDIVIAVLQLFENHDLAFVVQSEIDKQPKG